MGKHQKLDAPDNFLIHPGNTTFIYIYYIIYIRIYTYIMPRFFLVDQCWRYRIRKYYGYNMIQADSICTVNLSKLSNISRSFYGHVIGSREAPFCCSSQLRCPRCSVVFLSSRHLQVKTPWWHKHENQPCVLFTSDSKYEWMKKQMQPSLDNLAVLAEGGSQWNLTWDWCRCY